MKIRCTQCGAEVPIEEDSGFIQCPYCDTHLFVELDRTVAHYILLPNIEEKAIAPALMRDLSARELNQPAEVEKAELVYFPFWQITTQQDRKVIIPAATSTIETLGRLSMPAGDQRFFDPGKISSGRVSAPETLLDTALNQVKRLGLDDEAKESALIHLPLYFISYSYGGGSYEAAVDAVSGSIYADEHPPLPVHDKDRFFGLMMVLATGIFIVEGILIKGFGFTLLAYAVTSVPLYLGIRALLKSRGW